MHSALYIFVVAMLAVLTTSAPEPPANLQAPSDAFARIECGQTMVVQNGFSISFFDKSSALRRLELRSSCVIRPGKCGFSNRFIFMPDIGFGIAYKNGRWQPAGCAIFDRNGKTVREFSAAEGTFVENSSANAGYFRAAAVFFIDENTVAVKTQQGTFLYNIVSDTTVLKNCGGRRHEHGSAENEHDAAGNEHASAAGSGEPAENEHDNFGSEHGFAADEHAPAEDEHRPAENEHRPAGGENEPASESGGQVESKHEDPASEHGERKNEHGEHGRPKGGAHGGGHRSIIEHGKPHRGKRG